MKKIIALIACLSVPAIALADNVGNCGWGSKLFDGQRGIAPQVLAVTTNGTSGNQTFAISSGTSGCSQDGVVKSSWKTAAFIDSNMNKLARDMSRGEGESLESLAFLLDVSADNKAEFNQTLKENFGSIFSDESVNTDQVRKNLVEVLNTSDSLSQYSVRV